MIGIEVEGGVEIGLIEERGNISMREVVSVVGKWGLRIWFVEELGWIGY